MATLLVDVCCGPCSIPLEELYMEKLDPKISGFDNVFFYVSNFNVHPEREYNKRVDSIKKVAKSYKHDIFVSKYSPKEWFECVKGYENEPEGGKRCSLCYAFRLEKAASYAKKKGFDAFTTTLTTGPTKDALIINKIGNELAIKYAIQFLELDLKKNSGFMKSVLISKRLGLYRQNYCGCIYSIAKTDASKTIPKNKTENTQLVEIKIKQL